LVEKVFVAGCLFVYNYAAKLISLNDTVKDIRFVCFLKIEDETS